MPGPFYTECGCTTCTCKKAKEVCYSGPALVCSDIQPKDNLDVALQKIDDKLCGVNLGTNVLDIITNNPTLLAQFQQLVVSVL